MHRCGCDADAVVSHGQLPGGKEASMQQSTSLSLPHFLTALAVMAIWGTNFVVIRIGLAELPPLLMAALRFTFVFFPMALFLPRPKVPLIWLASYGVLVGSLQFGLLLVAMERDISPGLASVVAQAQVFFTIGLAIVIDKEKVLGHQWVALSLAAGGMVLIGVMGGGDATVLGLLLTLCSAFSWAAGNMVARATPGVNMLAYVVWSGLFGAVPLFLLAALVEGPQAVSTGILEAPPVAWAVVLWQAVGNSLFGYAVYGWLLANYRAASVAPLTLLVPVFGLSASVLVLGESLPVWKITAALMIIGGLAINQYWPVLRGMRASV